ncbi:hypothetical protein OR571_22560, partial [Psychrobacillus sp. NEAU-3TGS]|uniref:hypothetical protein n=1 Tax=Psychrobacillus sp. NEAU-3TGS TaxID=2995412 RepID=UPI002495AC77
LWISQQVLLIEAQGGDTCGLTARPAVSVRLERKSIDFAVSLYDAVSQLCALFHLSFPFVKWGKRQIFVK